MIIIPKWKEVEVNCGTLTVGLRGLFKFEAVNKFSGKKRLLRDWQDNTLLTSGLNNLASQNPFNDWCHVGSAGTPFPSASDTQLYSFENSTNTVQASSYAARAAFPYFGYKRITYRLAPVGSQKNYQEVGIGWDSSGAVLICRHLILNADGIPAAISVDADEYLDVTYELRYYPPLDDVVQINGATLNGVNYDVTTRAAEINNGDAWGQYIGSAIGEYSSFVSDWRAYDGNIGTLFQSPSGNAANCDNANQFNEGYVNNSFERVVGSNTGSTGWNLGAGIRSIRIKTTAGWYQSQFDSNPGGNTIPKDSNYLMTMKWLIGWTAYPNRNVIGKTEIIHLTESTATIT